MKHKDDGTTRATYGYTAYGSDESGLFTGADKPDAQNPAADPYNEYRYNGKRYDAASGTYDMGFRNYDPGLNRFLTRDMCNGALADMTLGSDPYTGNRYAFAGGNPIAFVELDGHLFGVDISDIGHAVLDVAGQVPVIGEVADGANAIWYAAEGNRVDAGISAAGMIPYAALGLRGRHLGCCRSWRSPHGRRVCSFIVGWHGDLDGSPAMSARSTASNLMVYNRPVPTRRIRPSKAHRTKACSRVTALVRTRSGWEPPDTDARGTAYDCRRLCETDLCSDMARDI
ncbi:RHS repeat-associated core domain-containing protein [Streptomyces sp. NPDC060366]|uniref:RHS repeat-associated core domain-containing protein n=1 Tax=Streptomyces sp. NPDC060366 TaxID=3347105 RepID=UPI00364A12A3